MGMVSRVFLFKETRFQCDDPLGINCKSEEYVGQQGQKALEYLSRRGWDKNSSGKISCISCRNKKEGTYTRRGDNYTLYFERHILSEISMHSFTTMEDLSSLLRSVGWDIKDVKIESSSVRWGMGSSWLTVTPK